MKNKRKFYLYFVLTIIIMLIIFALSQQDGDNSSNTSFKFAGTIIGKFAINMAKMFLPMFDPIDVVRELAHAFEFFVLALTSYNMFVNSNLKPVFLINIIFGVIYAVSDEIHQLFVPYRTFQLLDIIIDSLGIILGSIFVFLLVEKREKKQ